jgi:type 1 glutamine amidotransferase
LPGRCGEKRKASGGGAGAGGGAGRDTGTFNLSQLLEEKAMSLFRRIAILLALSILGSVMPAAEGETRILLIGHKPDHPRGTHMYLETCRLLAKCLEQTPGVKASVSDGWPRDPDLLRGVKAIVLYSSPGGDILLAESHRKEAEEMLRAGVGLTAIHWATGAKKEIGPAYQEALGGWFHTDFSGLDTSKQKLVMADPAHPVSRGWKDYDLRDEFYLDLRFAEATKPISRVNVKGKDQVVAWVIERSGSNGGRSFGTTLGHFFDNFGIEAFRKAIVNGILWTARLEIPEAGAPCKLDAADLVLPSPIVPPREGKREVLKLFNGKDLEGWVGHSKHWSVQEGVIVGKNTEKVPVSTYLLTKGEYTDFRLTAAVKLVRSEMHSGIAHWGRIAPEKGDPFTYAGHLVMFPSGWGFYDLYGRESLPVDPEPAKKVGKQHDWNELEILAQGNRIRLVVNGELVADWRDPEPDRIQKGPIGLQLHSNDVPQEVHFKDLTLETFPEDRLLTVKK